MDKLRKLLEERGELRKQIRTYLDSKERQELADKAADAKLKELEARHDNLDAQIDAETRQAARESAKPLELSKQEERDVATFDIAKLLRHMRSVLKGGASRLDGVEAEMVQEGEREAREAQIPEVSGIMLPRLLVRRAGFGLERRDMSVTGGTNHQYGGELVPTQKQGLADDFYNGSVLRQNGALVLEGLVGNIDLPRYVKPSDPTKKAENAGADELNPQVAKLALSPKRLPAFIDLSDQLLLQSPVALEAFLRRALTEQMLGVQEVAFFHGGGTNEPTGIASTSSIGSVIGGTNGAAPDWADLVDLETAVAVVNAAVGNLRYITNSKVRGKLKKTVKVSSTDSMMLWDDRNGGLLNGYQPLVTNAVSSTLTKGSASGVCSAIFFGNVNDFVIGYWGGISLELIRDSANAKLGMHTLVANAYYDGGVLRPKSFAAMLDALTT